MHTPGPWKMTEYPQGEHNEGGKIESSDDLTVICELAGGLPEHEIIGNGNLIAVAPELYESLKWAMHHVENVFALANPEDPEFPELLKARAVIAKVEGR